MRALLDIRIGTMIRAHAPDPATYVRQIVGLGFESIEPFFWQTMNKDLPLLARQLREAIGDADVTIDTLGMFGNPLEDGDLDRQTLAGWEALIDNAHHFGARTIAGFTGRVRGQPIEASLPQFKKVWGELARRAADKGVRLAFENCAMDGNWASGDWNIAHNPDAWELMFDAVPNDNLGLEWEPCHQLVYLIDPLPQIHKWAAKIFHVHGKDATVRWDVVREHGVFGKPCSRGSRRRTAPSSCTTRPAAPTKLLQQGHFIPLHLVAGPDGRTLLGLCAEVTNRRDAAEGLRVPVTVRSWDLDSGAVRDVLQAWSFVGLQVRNPALPYGNRFAVLADQDGLARLWNLTTGENQTTPYVYEDTYALPLPDGTAVVLFGLRGSRDTMMVWDRATAQERACGFGSRAAVGTGWPCRPRASCWP